MANLDTTWRSLVALIDPPTRRVRSMKRVDHLMLDDGYLIYRARVAAKSAGAYDLSKEIHEEAVRWRLGLDESTARDPADALRPTERNLALLGEFLDLAREKGIEVRVMLLPLHPQYETQALTPQMRDIRTKFGSTLRAMCAVRGCMYRDFTSLASYGGSPNNFWDGAHQTSENTRRMMNVLFGLPPEKIVAVVPTDQQILKNPPKITTLNTR
jgi:hypothetical protein